MIEVVALAVTWVLEQVEPDPERHDFPVLLSLSDLPACIAAMDS